MRLGRGAGWPKSRVTNRMMSILLTDLAALQQVNELLLVHLVSLWSHSRSLCDYGFSDETKIRDGGGGS